VQPQLENAAGEAAKTSQAVIDQVKEPALDAAKSLKNSAAEQGASLKKEAKKIAKDVSD